LCVST